MMPVNKVLAGALLLQVALGAATWWPKNNEAAAAKVVVDSEMANIQAVTIVGMTGTTLSDPLTMTRQGDGWVLTSEGDYPALTDKVEDALSKLVGLTVRTPIATTLASHQALNVGDDAFSRKVTLTTASGSTELYLGAAGTSGMHVRVAGSNDVFAAKGVNAFGIPDTSRRYYDPKYTVADMGLVDFVKVKNLHGELTATRADDTWSLGELPEGEQVDKSTLDKIGRSLSLRINGIVGKGLTLAEYGLDGTRRIEWSTTEDETTTNHGFTIGRMEEGRYYVKADDNDFVIQVSETALKTPLQATSFSKPIGEEAQAPPPPPGGMPGMGGMDGPPRGLPPRLPPTP